LEQFRSDRRFYSHTQPLTTSDFVEGKEDESESTLLLKFFDELTVTIDNCGEKSRYWWVEEINNPQLYKIVISLPKESVELLTLIYVDKLNQSEISKIFNISQAAISQRLKKINEIFVFCL
jgi:DNA-directed RNA polymerase specialized sigma subunit